MHRPNVLMVGTGEYTTGFAHSEAARSDKSAGVVALTLFDLQRRGKVGRLLMAGTNGTKFPGIRRHLQRLIAERYHGLKTDFTSFPSDDVASDPLAYRRAIDQMTPGDFVTVFTPDNTHFQIAVDAIERGLHVLVAKPLVQTLSHHRTLADAAKRHKVLVAMEVHKRWDPIYVDARDRIRTLGEFSFFTSYMSQPKSQLQTFSNWAGRGSDISYYLNAHHVDFNLWAVRDFARPVSVTALGSTGVASGMDIPTEDTITLSTQWENTTSGNRATALYTASWIAPKSDVHSQQRFFYMGHYGEIQVDQAHRGYSVATDDAGFASPNPLFMKYAPDADGCFAGQSGYGYRSIEAFADAVGALGGGADASDFEGKLATVAETVPVTAILEAGRQSLDHGGCRVNLEYDSDGQVQALIIGRKRS